MKKNRATIPRQEFEELRKKKGTQDKVAYDLGITETHLRNLEKGRSDPSTDLLFLSAHYFGAPVEKVWPDIAERAQELNQQLQSRNT